MLTREVQLSEQKDNLDPGADDKIHTLSNGVNKTTSTSIFWGMNISISGSITFYLGSAGYGQYPTD